MKQLKSKQRLAAVAMVLALMASLGLASASGLAVLDHELLRKREYLLGRHGHRYKPVPVIDCQRTMATSL